MSYSKKFLLALCAMFALTGCDPSLVEETPEVEPGEEPNETPDPERDSPLIDLQGYDIVVMCEDGQSSAGYREANVLLQTFEIYTGARTVHLRNTNAQGFFVPNEEFYPWYEVEFGISDVRLMEMETLEALASEEITFWDFGLVVREFDALHTVDRYSSSLLGVMADTNGSPNSIGSVYHSSLNVMSFIYADTGETVPREAIGYGNCFNEDGTGMSSVLLVTNIPL